METKVILSNSFIYYLLYFSKIGPTDLQLSPAPQKVPVFLTYFPKFPSFTTTQSYAANAGHVCMYL